MDIQFIKELFPFRTEAEIQSIVEIVIQANPLENQEQQLDQIFNMLSGDEMVGNLPQPASTSASVGERIQEHLLQGQELEFEDDFPDDVGPTPTVNNAMLNAYFEQLQIIYPDAAPDYLWTFCQSKGANFNLGDAIDEISRDGYVKAVVDSIAIWERLKEALPGWDPSYLEEQSKKLALEEPNNLQEFVNAALENNDPPTMEQYLKRKKEEDNLNFYREKNFKLDKFLEIFPDPEKHFRDPNRQNPLQLETIPEEDLIYARTFLYNRYSDIRKRHVDLVFKMKKMRLMDCCDMLDKIQKGLKVKRRDEVMPESNNLELLQEIIYIKHRKLIHRILKYKDETYKKFKEQARALNLLETCTTCGEAELIPEECFNCQKGCVFCKECVQLYIEVRMGEGLNTFPCCNCDSEFSLHILQLVLPQHFFERLALKFQSEEIKKADVEGIEFCPFCDFASVPPENTTIFICENDECLKHSCRLCRHESHIPKRCNEIEYDEDVRRRTYIENMMTEALARTCYQCKKKFIKSNGCNKMTCSCGALMCYLCSAAITGYDHFGAGKPCELHTNDAQIDLSRVQQRAQQAKQELGNVEIKFDPTVGIETFFQA